MKLSTMLGLDAGAQLVGTGINAISNKALQEDAQEFNAEQAEAQRNWASNEAQLARDWQTNANQIAMDYNSREARIQRAWEEQLSSTEIRRMMRDMEAAGLNPILASQYSGASTPTGGVATAGGSQSTSAPSGSAANSNPNRVALGNMFDSIKSTLTTAKKIHDLADSIEHSYSQREKNQSKSYDEDEFFKASMRRLFEDE